MKPKEIQELLDFIASSGLAEVNIETEQFKISVKKNSEVVSRTIEIPISPIQHIIAAPMVGAQSTVSAEQTPAVEVSKGAKETPAVSTTQIIIKSPMIGTFYRSPNPETPSFVNVGDEIKEGQPVCIIEAMKLFNEIEAEVSGKIVKILVENATPVEYDQPLFIIEP